LRRDAILRRQTWLFSSNRAGRHVQAEEDVRALDEQAHPVGLGADVRVATVHGAAAGDLAILIWDALEVRSLGGVLAAFVAVFAVNLETEKKTRSAAVERRKVMQES
jgi:hypothetical protein